MKTKTSPTSFRGFTLAEVMIAMGIVASVMVGLLGMIPLGVRTVREAANLTISGRIAQEVISNIQQANWSAVLSDYDKKVFYFDNDGFAIRTGNSSKPSFQARVLIPTQKINIGATEYSVETLKKILVEVEFTPDGMRVPLRKGERINPNVINYNFYVANQNKLQ